MTACELAALITLFEMAAFVKQTKSVPITCTSAKSIPLAKASLHTRTDTAPCRIPSIMPVRCSCVSALLYLFMEMDSNGEVVSSCIQILNTMYKMMEQTKAKELVEQKNDPLLRVVTKEEIFKLK